jgi:ankyrin repeat protein
MGPIHGAVNAGDPNLVHLVLQGGDNVNRLGPANNTPLHRAVINGDEMIARILLTVYKADKQLKNKDGKTPAQIAEEMFGSSSSLYVFLQ